MNTACDVHFGDVVSNCSNFFNDFVRRENITVGFGVGSVAAETAIVNTDVSRLDVNVPVVKHFVAGNAFFSVRGQQSQLWQIKILKQRQRLFLADALIGEDFFCQGQLILFEIQYTILHCALIYVQVSEVCIDSKFKLIDENFFEARNIILFIKKKHRLFILNRVNRSE